MRKPKRPADLNLRARYIIDLALGEKTEENPDEGKNPNAVALGRLGGKIGGKARAKKLSAKRRRAIAKKGAKSRWKK